MERVVFELEELKRKIEESNLVDCRKCNMLGEKSILACECCNKFMCHACTLKGMAYCKACPSLCCLDCLSEQQICKKCK